MPAPRGVFAALIAMLVLVAAATPAATVGWPPSSGLLLAEVVTGGASASDEYVEIANAGTATADLGGLELVYASASGATVTRKVAFEAPLPLDPGRHLLVANAAGVYAATADATYSGGIAADGGSLALRVVGGAVIDSVGWGTAAGTFVEGAAAPAPPARSSIERLPGGSGGNSVDTNDNWSDWLVQASPVPQNRASDPQPVATPTPEGTSGGTATPHPTPTESPTATPGQSPTPAAQPTPTEAATLDPSPVQSPGSTAEPTTTPTETPTAEPTRTAVPTSPPTSPPSTVPTITPTLAPTSGPTRSQTVEPTTGSTATPAPMASATPTAAPSPTPGLTPAPAPTATPTASASPSPSAAPPAVSIAAARSLPIGTRVHVWGTVTAGLGLVDDSLISIADDSAGIFVRVASTERPLPRGTRAEIVGVLAAPYGQIEIRDVTVLTAGTLGDEPEPRRVDISDVGEATEGSVVNVHGTVTSVTTSSGHLVIEVSDVTGTAKLYAYPASGLTTADVAVGKLASATGVVSQRATATGKLDGYRIWLRSRDDLATREELTPEPTVRATAHASATPTPTPTATAPATSLAAGLGTRGAAVDVEAVVTATAGLFEIDGPTIVVDDGTAAVAVVLPPGVPAPGVAARVHLVGKVGRWETGPIVRATELNVLDSEAQPEPVAVTVAPNVGLEWRLVRLSGRIDKLVRAGARWRAEVLVNGQRAVVLAEPAVGAIAADAKGRTITVTGIVRRATSDSDSFQLLPRSRSDVKLGPAIGGGTATPDAAMSLDTVGGASPDPSDAPRIDVSAAASHEGSRIAVAGVVTLAGDGEATIQDGTGSLRVGGAEAAPEIDLLEVGDAVDVSGVVETDQYGLILRADPDSVFVLPAVAADPSPAVTPASSLRLSDPLLSQSDGPAADAARIARSGGPVGDPRGILGLFGLAVVALVAGALAVRAVRRRKVVSDGEESPA